MAINACITVCDLISDRAFAMYAGNTVPTERPRRADRSTYETYAKLPSWHVEEVASLAAGLIPVKTSTGISVQSTVCRKSQSRTRTLRRGALYSTKRSL